MIARLLIQHGDSLQTSVGLCKDVVLRHVALHERSRNPVQKPEMHNEAFRKTSAECRQRADFHESSKQSSLENKYTKAFLTRLVCVRMWVVSVERTIVRLRKGRFCLHDTILWHTKLQKEGGRIALTIPCFQEVPNMKLVLLEGSRDQISSESLPVHPCQIEFLLFEKAKGA